MSDEEALEILLNLSDEWWNIGYYAWQWNVFHFTLLFFIGMLYWVLYTGYPVHPRHPRVRDAALMCAVGVCIGSKLHPSACLLVLVQAWTVGLIAAPVQDRKRAIADREADLRIGIWMSMAAATAAEEPPVNDFDRWLREQERMGISREEAIRRLDERALTPPEPVPPPSAPRRRSASASTPEAPPQTTTDPPVDRPPA